MKIIHVKYNGYFESMNEALEATIICKSKDEKWIIAKIITKGNSHYNSEIVFFNKRQYRKDSLPYYTLE